MHLWIICAKLENWFFIFGTVVQNLRTFNFLHLWVYTVSRLLWHQLRLPLSPPRCFSPCCSEPHQSDLPAICGTRPFGTIPSVKREQWQIDFTVSCRRELRRTSSSAVTYRVFFYFFVGELKNGKVWKNWLCIKENTPLFSSPCFSIYETFFIAPRQGSLLPLLSSPPPLSPPPLSGCQSYSGHPRVSLFLLFSSFSQSMSGWKYSISGKALILGWPVIMVMASGHGLLKPSFITLLQTLAQRETDSCYLESFSFFSFWSTSAFNVKFVFLLFLWPVCPGYEDQSQNGPVAWCSHACLIALK